MTKKLIAILMVFTTLICFASCSKKDKAEEVQGTTIKPKKAVQEIKITVDINPSLEFVLDDANRVVSVKSNEKGILNSIDYKNKNINEVVLLITNALINSNKLNKDSIDILITSKSSDSNVVSSIIKKLKDDAVKASLNLNFFMVSVDKKDKEISKFAEEHNISYGKAYFCNQIVQSSNGTITMEELLDKNVTEIVEQAKNKGVDLTKFQPNLEKLNSESDNKPTATQKNSVTATSKNKSTTKTSSSNKTTSSNKTDSSNNTGNSSDNTTTITKPNTTNPVTPSTFWHTQPKYDFDMMWPANDVWIVKKNNQYGIMDSNGKMTFAFQNFDVIYLYNEIILWDDNPNVIDKYGSFVKNFEGGWGGYGLIDIFDTSTNKVYQGYALNGTENKYVITNERSSSGIYGVYIVKSISIKDETDSYGETNNVMTIDTSYETIAYNAQINTMMGKAKIYKSGSILSQEYDSILMSTDSKYFSVRTGGKFYMVDSNGQKLYSTGFDLIADDFGCSLEFLNCDYFNADNLAAVKVNGKWGFIKKTF